MCSLPVAANESISLTDSVSLPGPQCFLFEIYGNLMGANMGHWLMHETLCFRLMTSAKYKIRLRAVRGQNVRGQTEMRGKGKAGGAEVVYSRIYRNCTPKIEILPF